MTLKLENIDLGGFGISKEDKPEPDLNIQVRANMDEALKVNPDEHAKITHLSQQSEVPEFAVKSDPVKVEHKLKLDNIDFNQMSVRNPNTAKYLTDFNNSVIAQDDLDILQSIEDIFDFGKTFENIGESIKTGFSAQGAGLVLAGADMAPTRIQDLIPASAMPMGMAMPGEIQQMNIQLAENFGITTDEELQAAKQESVDKMLTELRTLQEKQQSMTPEDLNLLEQGVRAGVESLANMAPGFGLMLLSGGRAAPLLTTMGVQTYGASYGEGRAEGLTPQEATWFAGIDAAIEVGTELLPTKTLETILTGQSKGLAKESLKFAVREMGTEQLATAGQSLNSFMFGLDKEMEQAETIEEKVNIQLRRQAVTAIATVVAGGAQITAVSGIRKGLEALTQDESAKENKSQVEQQKIDQLNEKSEKSKLRERDKESFKQFVNQADGENNTNVFIDGAQTSLYMQRFTTEEIAADEALTLLDQQVREAANIGTDIQIPVADFAADIAGTEHYAALRDSMTMSEETTSPFRQDQVKQETETYVRTLMDEAQESASEYVEAQEIYTQVRDQLIDTGQVTPANASIMAQVVPAWATAQARRQGKTVQQVYQDSGLVIEGPLTGERARLEGEMVLEQEPSFKDAPIVFEAARDKFLNVLPEDAEVIAKQKRLLFQKDTEKEARGYYDPANSVIRLTEAADLSTFLHEFAHFMYEMEVNGNTEMLQSINSWYKRNAEDVAKEANSYLGDEFDALKQELPELSRISKYSNPRAALTNVRGGWTKNKIRKELKQASGGSSKFIHREVAKFDNAEELADNIFYHGTGGYVSRGLKASITMSEREAERSGGGGYGERYWAVSLSKSKNIASNFTGQSSSGTVYSVILKKNANVISRPDLQDAVELDDIIEDLWNQGVDAVKLGDWTSEYSEQELAVLNPYAIVKYNISESYPVFNKKKFAPLTDEEVKTAYETSVKSVIELNRIRKSGLPREERDALLREIPELLFQDQDIPDFTKPTPGSITPEDVINYLDNKTTGVKDKDSAIRRAVHEQFARGFETYLMEGKAPSIELRNAFRAFARWLARIYQSLRGTLNVKLDAEMRQVFDRMLATEEQIQAAEARARVEPMFTDAAMAGMTEEEFADYQKRQEKVKDVQSETLRDKIIKQLTRQTQAWWNEEKQDIIDEEIDSLNKQQVYIARERLKTPLTTREFDDIISELDKELSEIEARVKQLTKENDTIGQFLSKEGGLNRESMLAEGVDPEHFKDKIKVFGKLLFPRKGGMTADDVAEKLNEENYQGGNLSSNDALEIIFDMLSDDTNFINQNVSSELDVLSRNMDTIERDKIDVEQQSKQANIKLDHATVKDMVGEEKTDKLGRVSVVIPPELRGMTAKGQQGVHPDEAAAFFGYSSGSEMLNDLTTTPNIKAQAEANAEARMIDRHGDILTDGTIEQEADEAVRNEERGELILSELKTLAKGTNAPVVERNTIKDLAAINIGKLSFREIHPGKYRKAEIRAAQESAAMLATGNREGAATAKMRQVMNYYLGMAATEAKNETTKIVDRMARYNKKKVREEIMKSEGGYWDQIVKILNRFEFRKSATLKEVESINTWVNERMESVGDGLVLSNAVLNESYVTHWKNVPFSDLQGVSDSVKNIEHVARYANKLTRMQEEIDFNKLVGRWVNSMNEKVETRFVSKRADVAEGRKWGRWFMAQMTKIPVMASWLDGGERAGISHQIMVQPFTDAYNAEIKLWEKAGKPVMDAIENRSKADRKRHNQKNFIPEIDDNLYGHQILSVALNTGNQSNLKKMLLGEGWANPENEAEITFDNPKLQAVLSHMTRSDWELVQQIWDQMETLYPQLAEVHRRTTGLTPPKVRSTPVETEFGIFKGGYYPVKYDPNRSHRAALNEDKLNAEIDSMFSNNASIQASVNAGATNERTGYYAPIRLSLDVVPAHFQETIHYITHHDPIREVNRLTRNTEVAQTIKEKLGPEEYAQLKPWLNDIAKDGREAPTKMFWDDMLGKLRFGVTLGTMGFKASTGIIQISGLSNSVAEVGTANMMQSLRSILGSTTTIKQAWGFAVENSQVLEHRTQTMDREIKNAMKRIEGKRGVLAAAQEASMKHIALIQTYIVDLPSWHAAYIKGMKEWGDETRSFQYADWVIENVQGSGATKDMARIMRGQSETGRMFTMFMTFFSSLWNMERDLVKGARRGLYSTTSVAAKVMFLFTIPVIFEMMMRGELGEPEDDEDDRLQKMLTGVAMYPVQSIPFIRDIASATTGGFGYNISPLQSIIEQGTRTIPELVTRGFTDEEITKGQVKGATKFIGATLGIPGMNQAWATGEHLYDVIEKGEEFTTHELLFGPRR